MRDPNIQPTGFTLFMIVVLLAVGIVSLIALLTPDPWGNPIVVDTATPIVWIQEP